VHATRIGWLLLAVALAGCSDTIASSDFEASADGWTMAGDVLPAPELRATGGNPGGCICGTDLMMADIWYFVAPSKYLGNVSRAYGKRLTWDIKGSSEFYLIKGRDLVMQGPGVSIIFNVTDAPGLDWTPYSATIDDKSGWKLDTPEQPDATADQIKQVLQDLHALRIRGEYVDGPDHECLDNVEFGIK
jgi:hypothetical protein